MTLLLTCLSKTVVCKFLKTSLELRFKQFLFDDQDYLYYRCAHDFSPQMIHFTIFLLESKNGENLDDDGIQKQVRFSEKTLLPLSRAKVRPLFFKEKFLFRLFTKTPFSRDFYCAALFELVNNRSLTCGCESSSILFCSKKS